MIPVAHVVAVVAPADDRPHKKGNNKVSEQILEVQTEAHKDTSDRPSRGESEDEDGWIVPPAKKTVKAAQSTGASSSVGGVNALSADTIDPG